MPEERNRIEVDQLSALLLCPDERSAAQLGARASPAGVEVVGDVMADATRIFEPIARKRDRAVRGAYVALTIHREANTEPERLRGDRRRGSNASGRTLRLPRAPAHASRARRARDRAPPNVEAVEPLGYLEMLALVAGAEAVVTDSGGLQKEAYWLGVPCVTLRPSTEWVDTVAAGANRARRAGASSPAALAAARFPADAPPLYGDGHAAERIAAALYA